MHPWWINVLISIKNLTDRKLVNPYVSITVEWNQFHTGLWSVNPAELIDKHVSHLLPSGCCCERSWTLLSCPSHTLKHTHTHTHQTQHLNKYKHIWLHTHILCSQTFMRSCNHTWHDWPKAWTEFSYLKTIVYKGFSRNYSIKLCKQNSFNFYF